MTAVDSGITATGEYVVAADGYFPPLLLVEAMAQVGGIAGGQHEGEGGVLAALTRVQLPSFVEPKAKLTVSSRVVKKFGRLIQIDGVVSQEGNEIASATLTLAIGE